MVRNYMIFGASKGLGDAFVKGLPEPGTKCGLSLGVDLKA